MIKDSGDRTAFSTGAVRDLHTGKGRMDLLPWNAIMEVSKHCEAGALKYGEHNVDKGIPVHSLIDSGIRHIVKFWLGWDDEPHLTAACWNILWALEMMLVKPEMDDRPLEKQAPDSEPQEKPAPKKKKEKTGPSLFQGYGAKLKQQVHEALSQRQQNGLSIKEIADASNGGLTEEVLIDMLNAKKVPYEKWELAADTLNALLTEEDDG